MGLAATKLVGTERAKWELAGHAAGTLAAAPGREAIATPIAGSPSRAPSCETASSSFALGVAAAGDSDHLLRRMSPYRGMMGIDYFITQPCLVSIYLATIFAGVKATWTCSY